MVFLELGNIWENAGENRRMTKNPKCLWSYFRDLELGEICQFTHFPEKQAYSWGVGSNCMDVFPKVSTQISGPYKALQSRSFPLELLIFRRDRRPMESLCTYWTFFRTIWLFHTFSQILEWHVWRLQNWWMENLSHLWSHRENRLSKQIRLKSLGQSLSGTSRLKISQAIWWAKNEKQFQCTQTQ